jgi:hypothetical protein
MHIKRPSRKNVPKEQLNFCRKTVKDTINQKLALEKLKDNKKFATNRLKADDFN